MEEMVSLLGKSAADLRGLLASWGEPAWRGDQLYTAIYRTRARDLTSLPTLPRPVRERLAAEFSAARPEVASKFRAADGTIRYLLRLEDAKTVECVLMPEDGGIEGSRPRHTICISTQVGCPVDCQFCLTAQLGLQRNLTAGEIVGQVLLVAEENGLDPSERPLNLVFMGQGEPLLNFDNTLAAVRLLGDPAGLGLSTRRMTLSTAGIVPGIERLAKEEVRPRLAISLNASSDEQRSSIMPINRKWPIAKLLEACKRFPLRSREYLTFEYVLLGGLNDSPADARRVAKLLAQLPAKVNLIAWNPGPSLGFATPAEATVLEFQRVLRDADLPAFIRKPRGREIYAACGQLSAQEGKQ
jgi:23S rRNA (adenine2503-C2)-methyltransferase